MNKENEVVLEAEAIINSGSSLIIAYSIKGDLYMFTDHKDSLYIQKFTTPEKLINKEQSIELFCKFAKEGEEKLIVGFCIGNVMYIKKEYDLSTLDGQQIYAEQGCLVAKEFSFVKAGEKIELDFINAREKMGRSFMQQKDKKIKYNKEDTYEMQIVLNTTGKRVVKCILGDEISFFAKYTTEQDAKSIIGLSIRSKIKIKALIDDNNIIGFVLYDTMFVKKSYCDKHSYSGISAYKTDYIIKARIVDKVKLDVAFVEMARAETTGLAHATSVETIELGHTPPAEVIGKINSAFVKTIKLKYVPAIETTFSGATTIQAAHAETINTETARLDTTRLVNSFVENLRELNGKYCNIL